MQHLVHCTDQSVAWNGAWMTHFEERERSTTLSRQLLLVCPSSSWNAVAPAHEMLHNKPNFLQPRLPTLSFWWLNIAPGGEYCSRGTNRRLPTKTMSEEAENLFSQPFDSPSFSRRCSRFCTKKKQVRRYHKATTPWTSSRGLFAPVDSWFAKRCMICIESVRFLSDISPRDSHFVTRGCKFWSTEQSEQIDILHLLWLLVGCAIH